MGRALKKSGPEVMSCAGAPSLGCSLSRNAESKAHLCVKRQSPPEGDLLDGTACAQAELQKQKSSSLFAGAGQHVLCLFTRL